MRTSALAGMCLVGLAAIVVAIAACSAGGDDKPGGTGGSGATASSSGTGAGGFTGMGGTFNLGGMGGSCENTCSANLKEVIGCNGELIQTCTGDQACLNGECTNDPCGAAQASKSSYGCDFWTMKVDLISAINGACFVAYVANTWSVPVHIDVDYQGQPIGNTNFIRIPQGQGQGLTYGAYDPNVGLPVGEVAMLFLAEAPGGYMPDCPVAAAIGAEVGIIGSGFGTAIHFTTDRPVVAYQIIPYGGGSAAATSATLLLPTSAWDTNYIAINAYPKSAVVGVAQPSLNILAQVDNTEVTVLPKVAIVGGGGVQGTPANTPVTYNLNRGEYVQLSQDAELTGSPIQSNQPIGLWGGASCLSVPVSETACDGAHQQIPPVKALGMEYVGVRYRNRAAAQGEEAPPWRIVGAVDGTQLSWQPAPPTGAPTAINLGDVVEFNASGPFVATSQDAEHPFYLAAYMTGGSPMSGEGDPEWVNVIPAGQYLDDYVFFTDPTYSEVNLVVVRRPDVNHTFAEVNLGCHGNLTDWQPIGAYEYTRIDLVTGNFQNVGNCSNGRHEMSSELPFGVTVWGWGTGVASPSTTYVSYAYPAGASVQPINEVVIPPTPK